MRLSFAGFALAGFAIPLAMLGSARADAAPISRADLRWLDRVTYGINGQTVSAFERLGRRRFLEQQLAATAPPLPPAIAAQIGALEIEKLDGPTLLLETSSEQKRTSSLPDEAEKQEARRLANERADRLAYEATRRHLLRAVYAPDQVRQQLVWFWLNHFSVFSHKANLRVTIADYEERAVRPRVLGRFRDLVLATLTHPAMLQYLDNAQNAKGHLNENYARELMELHTLGVGGGYSQHDVEELARILTGVGVDHDGPPPTLKAELQPLYVRRDGFEFNPARHDMGDKVFLGHKIAGRGFAEVEEAVTLLARQPACGRFVAAKLAAFFVGDAPSPALVATLTKVFARTDGDLRQVVRALLTAREVASSGPTFKDPMHFVVSAIRLAYDGRPITNAHPVVNALNALGEPLYGRSTPDGYPLGAAAWGSSGQLLRRFEIARTLGAANGGLFEREDGAPSTTTGFPRLSSRLYFELLEPSLSEQTKDALERASSQQEWNTYLLASPEFNHR